MAANYKHTMFNMCVYIHTQRYACMHMYVFLCMLCVCDYRYKYIDMVLVLRPLLLSLKLITEELDFRMSSESFSYNHLTCGIYGSLSLKNYTYSQNEILQIFFRRLQTLWSSSWEARLRMIQINFLWSMPHPSGANEHFSSVFLFAINIL